MEKIKLNLGCGNNILGGYENYDKYPVNDKVKFIDLNQLPLPFDNDSVDEIILNNTLEHLNVEPYVFMMEIYRILKKDGVIKVSLPVFYNCVTHNRFYHNSGYFDTITTKDVKVSGEYANDFFSVVSFSRKRKKIKNAIQKIIAVFMDLFYDEYAWELKKNETDLF